MPDIVPGHLVFPVDLIPQAGLIRKGTEGVATEGATGRDAEYRMDPDGRFSIGEQICWL